MNQELEKLSNRLQSFGKENLRDILHFTATGLKNLFDCYLVRIYLEDLYEGMLICQYVTGQPHQEEMPVTQFVAPQASVMSQAFSKNEVVLSWKLPTAFAKSRSPFEQKSGIHASAVFPITHQHRPIGTLSLDWDDEDGFINDDQVQAVTAFLLEISFVIDRAKRFHQQITFSRHLDLARKKEAAWRMMRSAVKLIDNLTLASVLVDLQCAR